MDYKSRLKTYRNRRGVEIGPEQIVTWLERHFDVKKSTKQARICNPFTHDDGYHLWISLYKSKSKNSDHVDYWVHDFRPGNEECNSSFLSFVMRYKDCSYVQAAVDVCGSSFSIIKTEKKEKMPSVMSLPNGAEPIDPGAPDQRHVMNYVKRRGFSIDDMIEHKLHCTVNSVIFPYYEFDQLVYWQSRSILGKTFEFPDKEAVGVGKGDFLFGYDSCEPEGVIGITEACFGAMALGKGVTSSSGATLTEEIVPKLRLLNPKRVILAPDNDDAGKKSLKSNYFMLNQFFDIWYVLPPLKSGKDWADAMKKHGKDETRRFYSNVQRRVTIRELLRPTVVDGL